MEALSFCGLLLAVFVKIGAAGSGADEGEYYRIDTATVPEGIVPEVSGLLELGADRIMIATRRGQIYLVERPFAADAVWTLFVDGLQEPLGLLRHEGWIYTVQRGELSRLKDVDGDGRCDEWETVCDQWRISGNYHEYNYGPRLDPSGNFWVTTNKPFGDEPFGRVLWRGFALRITPQGEVLPTCSGLRSPAGLEIAPSGEVFVTDNQGEWCGANKLSHLEPGDFHGHPEFLEACHEPLWTHGHPGEVPDGVSFPEVARRIPSLKLPAVWFPYGKMGKSPSGLAFDVTGGKFGPFENQLFVGDQHDASVLRVFLEEVRGHWQGACFPFRQGLQSGVIRVRFLAGGFLLAGMSNRGWGSLGDATEGLQRIVYRDKIPFEILSIEALPDGFRLTFTQPVDPASAASTASYEMSSYTYLLHSEYGSPEVEIESLPIEEVAVSLDQTQVELRISGLREGFVHELHAQRVRSREGAALLHGEAYYTLIKIPRHR